MIISRVRLAATLKLDWRVWGHSIDLMNNSYYVPHGDDVLTETRKFLSKIGGLGLEYETEGFNCNAYAYMLYSFYILQAWKDKQQQRLAWPAGVILAESPSPHAMNICYTRDGWIWIEPQSGNSGPIETITHTGVWSVVI